MDLLSVILLILLTFSSGFFSGSEIAFFSLSSAKIKGFQKHRSKKKQLIAKLLQRPHSLLVTIYIFNTIVNILLQNSASSLFDNYSIVVRVGVPLFITLLIGEIIPKYLAIQYNELICHYTSSTIHFLQEKFAPIRKAVTSVTMMVYRAMFFFLKKEEDLSKEELNHAIKTSVEKKLLYPDEGQLIHGFLHLKDSLVKEHMRPRDEIIAFDIGGSIQELERLFIDEECSKIPVYEESMDQLLGIIHAKQFFLQRPRIENSDDLKALLEKPLFVPETLSARSLMKQFEEKKTVIAIVMNEYGTLSGLITKEDLMEAVIGEITDLRDQKKRYTRAGDHVIIASGKLELSEFFDIFQTSLNSPNNMVTIGGWLTEAIGTIPKRGVNYKTDNFWFHILDAEPNRIKRIYIRQLPQSGE